MFSFKGDDIRIYPGGSWLYYKIYMGPVMVDEWLGAPFRELLSRLEKDLDPLSFFFVRYMDPDFHLRLRIKISNSHTFATLVTEINEALVDWQSENIWKVEICTYVREIDRYGKNIELFEKAFSIDSLFWIKVFEQISEHEEFENIRWKLALASIFQYYRNLIDNLDDCVPILESCIETLHEEIKPTKSFIYQSDQKFREHQADLERYCSGVRIKEFELDKLFQEREQALKELFRRELESDDFFSTPKGRQNLTDLIHMSLNRGLRSKHRVQEFVLYRYVLKLVRASMAKRN